MSVAVNRGWKKGVRSLLQLAAGGALTGLVSAIAGGLSPATQAVIMAAWTAVVAAIHNGLEAAGTIPILLPTVPLVSLPTGEGP